MWGNSANMLLADPVIEVSLCGINSVSMLLADLVIVEVPVDGEAVSAYALHVVGAAQLRPPLDGHEAGVTLRPEELGGLLLLWSPPN